ncbi:hypothetical protein CerSpe_214510 [Prunus speciosa]
MEDVVIVGAGIAGLATAVALKRVGVEALVLEKSDGLRTSGAGLNLFPNAWFALDALGISHKLTSLYAPCKRGYITNIDTGKTEEVSFTKMGRTEVSQELRGVHRHVLLESLAEELPKDAFRFSSRISSIVTQPQGSSSIVVLHMEDGTKIKTKALIGCDGVHSVVARWLGLSAPVSSGRWAARGLATFPEGHRFNYEFQQFITADKRAGFVPLNDKELYWFLFCKSTSCKGKDMRGNTELIQREVIESLAGDLPQVFSIIVQHSDLSTLSWAPVVFRFPWDMVFRNVSQGNITVAGDAMHPMIPYLGQNECLALEDAVVLGQQFGDLIIREKGVLTREVAGALRRYAQQRRWRAAGVMTCSYLSSIEGSGWLRKFLRDMVFNRLLLRRYINNVIHFDCGKLPCISSNMTELENERNTYHQVPISIEEMEVRTNI